MKKKILSITIISAAFLVIIISMIWQAQSINPLAWTPALKPELIGSIAENELLSKTEWIDLKDWYGPEDIETDEYGNLYCGAHPGKTDFSDGRILKIDSSGNITTYCNTESWVTGMEFDKDGNLIVCDQKRGLTSVDKNGEITLLASEDENGNPFLIPNDIDIASDGIIYFSNTTSKIKPDKRRSRKILFEARPEGGLYKYNPITKEVTTLIDGSFYGNGVAVSQNNDFVLMVELSKYRVVRYWLKGVKEGQTDFFIENLPGLPNGISRRKDGSFWLGFTTRRSDLLDKVHPKPAIKKLIYAIPLWLQPKQEPFGMIMHISEAGEILKTYYDTSGEYVSEASSIEEYNGYIYIGGDITGHIGKYKLENK